MDGLPASFLTATVARRADHTDDLATFWLRPERPVAFAPGQYVTLALPDDDGRLVKRPYSVLSAPHEPEIELFIERVEGGALTPRIFDLGEGGTLGLRARAAGAFARDPACTHHVMACTVTGVAPFLSMLRHHAEQGGAEAHFLVVYGASGPDDLGPYRDELARLAARPGVTAVSTISRPWRATGWTGETGRVEDVLRKHLDALGWDPATTAGYGCGNPTMVANVQGVLRRAGLHEAHLHEEAYFPDPGEAAPAAALSAPPTALPTGARPSPRGPGGVALRSVPRPPDA